MGKLLSLDLSTNTGWAVFSEGTLETFGLTEVEVKDFNVNNKPEKTETYPKNIIDASSELAHKILNLYKNTGTSHVVIENTVKGRNRHTQRLLEFIHRDVLGVLISNNIPFTYLDPSEWRYILEMRLSSEDKKNNKLVSQNKKRGRITKKHLSVRLANKIFDLNLKLKDNDIADAINLGQAFMIKRGINEFKRRKND